MPDPALRRHRWPSGPSRPTSPPDPGAEALGTIRPPGPAGTPFVCGQARGAKACCRPGWAPEPSSGQPRPRDANARPHALPRREEEPHAAGGEHAPVRENQQLHRGPGPGGRDAAGAHHPRVTAAGAPSSHHQGRPAHAVLCGQEEVSASPEALRRAGRHRAVLPRPPQPHGAHQGATEKAGPVHREALPLHRRLREEQGPRQQHHRRPSAPGGGQASAMTHLFSQLPFINVISESQR
uniref:Potassium voltage-gated channel subfamily Q member 1 n=1 Tax=Rousettus aegyptiacus TaxID=9407 RepID=A0A7J8H082_ROUAE|nr:potassium voltage-gated channel subfamily Q member 1 [Rousettus aegyptiacus]